MVQTLILSLNLKNKKNKNKKIKRKKSINSQIKFFPELKNITNEI